MKTEFKKILNQFIEKSDKQYWHTFIEECLAQGKEEEPTEVELINYFKEKDPTKLSEYKNEIHIAQQQNPGLFQKKLSLKFSLREEHDEDDDGDDAESTISSSGEDEDEDNETKALFDRAQRDEIKGKLVNDKHEPDDITHLLKSDPLPDCEEELSREFLNRMHGISTPAAAGGKMPILNPFAVVTGKRHAEKGNIEIKGEPTKLQRKFEEDQQMQDTSQSTPNLRPG